MKGTIILISSTMLLAMAVTASAGIVAQDSASDPAYAGGWTTGTNGGTGFGAWDIALMDKGGNPYIATNSDVNIPNGGPAWALGSVEQPTEWDWAGVIAKRSILTPMGVGDVFSADLDNGIVPITGAGSGITFGFLNAAGEELTSLWVYRTTWWDSGLNYQVAGGPDTGIAMVTTGLHLTLRVVSATTFKMGITPTGGVETLFDGTFKNAGAVAGLDLRGYNNGVGTDRDVYVNNLSIDAVPEPATMAALGIGFAFLARRRRS